MGFPQFLRLGANRINWNKLRQTGANWRDFLTIGLQGVVHTGTDNWEFGLLKELKSMGYSIDYNKMDF